MMWIILWSVWFVSHRNQIILFVVCSYEIWQILFGVITCIDMRCIFAQVSVLPLTLTIHQHPKISMRRIDDILFILYVIKMNKFTDNQLQSINRVRLKFHVITMADILNGGGKQVRSDIYYPGFIPLSSTYTWLNSIPSRQDYVWWLWSIQAL